MDGKTNEITRFAPLLEALDLAGCVITADALHTQRDHAGFLVSDKKAHHILVITDRDGQRPYKLSTSILLHYVGCCLALVFGRRGGPVQSPRWLITTIVVRTLRRFR